ncbi:hypothetical protein [Methylobacterium sp. SyP6R]|uniref:hypothetical protein n=1 Tax=Methylobacterium sp. SyP6R TaxID=2718876 RepID=UPI001F312902|nr:hypothetical protein [Methylobacterium sp. SyP6R]MCF4124999.1 hypothetical protein [Methylobacterium sp. SyP6R]
MSNGFDVNDFDSGRRDPRRYMRDLKQEIRHGERGYHAALRGRTAGLLAMVYAGRDDYDLFCEWRQAKCFEGDNKLLSLTEENFRSYVARCVVKLGCSGSDILPSTLSKTVTLIKFLVKEEVSPEECAEFIKAENGFENAYQKAKEERARQKKVKTTSTRSSQDEALGATKNKATSKAAGKPKERREAGSARVANDGPHTVQLQINLWKKEWDDFEGEPEDGEIRLVKICWGKRGPTSPMSWSLVEYEVLPGEASDDESE